MIRYSTITTRYPAMCRRCGLAVPVGTRGRYGRGSFYHFASECPVGTDAAHPVLVAERERRDAATALMREDEDRADELARETGAGYTFGGWINDR